MVQRYLSVTDFNNILDNYSGRQIMHIPVTRTTSNISGEEILSDGNLVLIKAHFIRTGQNWDFEKAGFLEKGDAVALTKFADSVTNNDKIYSDGTDITMTAIDGDATTISITSATHGLSVGDEIVIANTTNYDGVYEVATTPDTTHLTIADTSHNKDAETSGSIIKDYTKFRIKEAYNVPGVFDSTGQDTDMVYTSCNLFLEEGA